MPFYNLTDEPLPFDSCAILFTPKKGILAILIAS